MPLSDQLRDGRAPGAPGRSDDEDVLRLPVFDVVFRDGGHVAFLSRVP